MKAESLERVLRARVDNQVYLEVIEEARRRKLSVSDVVRHALVERYWPGETAPPPGPAATQPNHSAK